VLRTGKVAKDLNGGRPRKLNSLDLAYLESCIERTPDLYLRELQQMLFEARGVLVSEVCIERSLKRRGFTRKIVTRPALERNEELRAAYLIRVGLNYRADQLVFVDEAANNRNTTKRKYAWSPTGTRARRHDYFVRGKRYSMLPALSLNGILHLDVREQSYTGASFNAFIDGLLDVMNPFPQKNSVIVMDNASIHKSEELRPMIENRGMRLEYLPPYSPDLDPIEEGFSAIKAWIRDNRDYTRMELDGRADCDPYTMFWRAVYETVTPEKAEGWFRDSGYL